MIIPIKSNTIKTSSINNDNSNNNSNNALPLPEWALLELNGEIIPPAADITTNTEDQQQLIELGCIDIMDMNTTNDINKNNIKMIISSHELSGKIEDLKEPFVVLEKKNMMNNNRRGDDDDDNDNIVTKKAKVDVIDISNSKENGECNVEYEAVGIVTKRIMFDEYPKTIMRQS